MTASKASDMCIPDVAFGGVVAKRPLPSSVIELSNDTVAVDASIGSTVGTLSLNAAVQGTPIWSLVEDGNGAFAVNEATGVVTVASALSSGSVDIKVKVRGVKPPILSPTFSLSVGEGGGGAYVAKAVHCDGTQWLFLNNPLTGVADSPNFTASLWVANFGPLLNLSFPLLFNASSGYNVGFSLSNTYGVGWYCDNGTGSSYFDFTGPSDEGPITSWAHYLFSLETDFASGLKRAALYRNDVLQAIAVQDDVGEAFSMPFSTLSGWAVFSDGDYGLTDMNHTLALDACDWFFAPGLSILEEGTNTISEVNRRKFITAGGKPADPSGFPAGTALFSGDETMFATNQGTGGAFTLTGTLANATTSPSD